MYCSYFFCWTLCIGTALGVSYNGEAPKHSIEPLNHELQHQHIQKQQHQQQYTQQQQQQHPQTLPGYHYSVPTSATPQSSSIKSQQTFAGYRYNTPATPTTTTTTTSKPITTTTIRPPVTDTQPSTTGNFYSPPAYTSYFPYTFYPSYYQQTHNTPALAIGSDANVALSDAPTYFVAQSEAVNISDKRPGDMTNFFVPREVSDKVEVPQVTQSAQQPQKELNRAEAATPPYNYPRPVSDAELAAEPLTTYQRVFYDLANYLIWQRAQAKQREQHQLPRIVTPGAQKPQVNTLPQATQSYGASVAPQSNYPAAQEHSSFIMTDSSATLVPQQPAAASLFAQKHPQNAPLPSRNVLPQYAANFIEHSQTLAQKRPTGSSVLLTGERYILPNSAMEYLEMPSESWELPSYVSMESVSPVTALSNSRLGFNKLDNRLVQTTSHGEGTKRPQEEKIIQVQQQYAESAQRYTPALQQQELQQHSAGKVNDSKFTQQTQSSTDPTQSKIIQPSATQFSQIPQWPQNLALQAQHHQQGLTQQQLATQQQQEQQRPLYNSVVAPLKPTAQWPVSVGQQLLPAQSLAQSSNVNAGDFAAQSTLATQQQEQQQAQQQNYLQRTEQFAQSPPTSSSLSSNSNSYFPSDTNVYRRPHISYGVPLESSGTGGYTYQRPVGE